MGQVVNINRTEEDQAYRWLSIIIESCTDEFQIECCRKLVDYYANIYGIGTNHYELSNQITLMEMNIES